MSDQRGRAGNSGGDGRISTAAAVLGTLVAALGLAWTIQWNLRSDNGSMCVLELIEDGGMPLDALVVGPHGESRRSDVRGITQVPCRWEGASVSLREPESYREIETIFLSWTGGRQRVHVSR